MVDMIEVPVILNSDGSLGSLGLLGSLGSPGLLGSLGSPGSLE